MSFVSNNVSCFSTAYIKSAADTLKTNVESNWQNRKVSTQLGSAASAAAIVIGIALSVTGIAGALLIGAGVIVGGYMNFRSPLSMRAAEDLTEIVATAAQTPAEDEAAVAAPVPQGSYTRTALEVAGYSLAAAAAVYLAQSSIANHEEAHENALNKLATAEVTVNHLEKTTLATTKGLNDFFTATIVTLQAGDGSISTKDMHAFQRAAKTTPRTEDSVKDAIRAIDDGFNDFFITTQAALQAGNKAISAGDMAVLRVRTRGIQQSWDTNKATAVENFRVAVEESGKAVEYANSWASWIPSIPTINSSFNPMTVRPENLDNMTTYEQIGLATKLAAENSVSAEEILNAWHAG